MNPHTAQSIAGPVFVEADDRVRAGAVQRSSASDLDELCVNTIRMLSVDVVQHANSGHPGMPMGAATMGYVLWTRHLWHNPTNPAWPDRDRFVLSAGHAGALLYSLLFLTGYDRTCSLVHVQIRSRRVAWSQRQLDRGSLDAAVQPGDQRGRYVWQEHRSIWRLPDS